MSWRGIGISSSELRRRSAASARPRRNDTAYGSRNAIDRFAVSSTPIESTLPRRSDRAVGLGPAYPSSLGRREDPRAQLGRELVGTAVGVRHGAAGDAHRVGDRLERRRHPNHLRLCLAVLLYRYSRPGGGGRASDPAVIAITALSPLVAGRILVSGSRGRGGRLVAGAVLGVVGGVALAVLLHRFAGVMGVAIGIAIAIGVAYGIVRRD